MPESCDTLLVHGVVVTMDAQQRVIADGAVAIRGREIVAVGTTSELTATYAAGETIDCSGCAIIPGLINGHAHVPMSLMRGLVADQQLDVWLFGYMFPVESRFCDAAFVATGTRLACAEMIRGGITTFVDMYYFEEEVAQVAADSGMRAICGQTVMRLPTPDAASFDDGLERARRFIERWHGHERIIPTIAPHAPYTCTDSIYHEAAALCRRYDVPLVTHLSETAREVVESRAERSITPIAYARGVGAFDVHCIAAHCVHATEEDIVLLHQHGVGVVTCPSSNLKLASGLPPIRRFIESGLRTGIGTDGPGSNDDQDLFAEIHLAALLPKGVSGDRTVVPARDAFALPTSSGEKAIHLDHIIGSLTAGRRADVVVVELDQLHSSPRYTYDINAIYSYLVYAARSADVRDVFVDGHALLRNGALQTLDAGAILQEARAIAEQINTFLAEREDNLLDKILAVGGVRQNEQFEVQVKALIGDPQNAERIIEALAHEPFTITKASERTQYDTFFLWHDESRGRLRLREDHRIDPGARAEPKYTITLTVPARLDEYPSAILIGRARYTAPAVRTMRFYREYFAPDRVVDLEKRRRRWRIIYKGEDFAINIDTLVGHQRPGPYIEIKSRTWSHKDADTKAALIGELLQLFEIDETALVKQEYVEL
ncbi:MAG TPA: amidohydrolase family protein [Roseiflexaceae bacterium]|nr:amidohydrolase family protein [Roseiflexaceae bacterium]